MALNVGKVVIAPNPSPVPAAFVISFFAATQGAASATATVTFELDATAPISFKDGATESKTFAREESLDLTPVLQIIETDVTLVPSGAAAGSIVPILATITERDAAGKVKSTTKRFCVLTVS